MPGLIDVLGAPITALATAASGIIHDFVADPAKKLELQAQIDAAAAALNTATLNAESSIIIAEAQGKDALERDWRPVVMLFLATVVGFLIFNGGNDVMGRTIPVSYGEWVLRMLTIGITGYVSTPVIDAFKAKPA